MARIEPPGEPAKPKESPSPLPGPTARIDPPQEPEKLVVGPDRPRSRGPGSPPIVPERAIPADRQPFGIGAKAFELQPRGEPKTWAILIGVGNYRFHPPLNFTVADAKSMADSLVKVGGVPPEQILRIYDDEKLQPDHKTLKQEIPRWLAERKIEPGDTLILFYSGHGVLGKDNRMYLAPSDVALDDLAGTAIAGSDLREQLRRCEATTKILLLDACHSGAAKAIKDGAAASLDGKKLAELFENATGVVTIAACQGKQLSWESPELRQGLFTHFVVEGLTGRADVIRDGRIDVDELYRYICDKVPQKAQALFHTSQDPVRSIGPDVPRIPVVLTLKDAPAMPPQPAPGPGDAPTPAPASARLVEDFRTSRDNELPVGWTGTDGIGVHQDGRNAWLRSSTDKVEAARSPRVDIQGDFHLSCEFGLGDNSSALEIALIDQGVPNRTLEIASVNGHDRITSGKNPPRNVDPRKKAGTHYQKALLRRVGPTYELYVGNEKIESLRKADDIRFDAVELRLRGKKTIVTLLELEAGPGSGTGPEPFVLEETFRGVRPDDLPKGWSGTRGIGVRQDGSEAWLQSAVDDLQRAQSPALNLRGDFTVECEFQLPRNGDLLEINLAGRDCPDLNLAVRNNNRWYRVFFGGEETSLDPDLASGQFKKAVLRREGDVYHLFVANKEVGVPRGSRRDSFQRVDLVLSGREARVNSLDLACEEATPEGRGPSELRPDFLRTARPGELPPGWTGSSGMSVRSAGRDAWLQSDSPRFPYARSPRLEIRDDFRLDGLIELMNNGDAMELILVGDRGPDQVLRVSNNNGWYKVSFGGKSQDLPMNRTMPGQVILSRQGDIYHLNVGGQAVNVPRGSATDRFRRIDLGLQGPGSKIANLGLRSGPAGSAP